MAKKSRKKPQKGRKPKRPVERRAKKQEKIGRYLIFIIIITMLLSVLYYTTMTRSPEELPTNNQRPAIDGFKIINVLKSVRISVTSRTEDLAVLVENNALSYDTMNRIKNSSISGVEDIIFGIGNPTAGEDYFTGSLIYIKFITDSLNDNVTQDIRENLDTNLGRNTYVLYRGYNGKLSSSIGGTDNTYTLGRLDTEIGDVLRAITFEIDRGGISHSFISIEQKKIPAGPIVSAEISNITAIHLNGSFISVSLENITERLNLTGLNIIKAMVLINSTISNQTIGRLNSLPDTRIDFLENRTLIHYSKSLNEIESILNEEGLNYSLTAGSIEFKAPPNSSIENISKILDVGMENITIYKEGTIIVPDEVIIDDELIQINNYKNLKAALRPESVKGQTIKVKLKTKSVGSITVVVGANEV